MNIIEAIPPKRHQIVESFGHNVPLNSMTNPILKTHQFNMSIGDRNHVDIFQYVIKGKSRKLVSKQIIHLN